MISYLTIFVFLLLGTFTYQKDLTTQKGSKGSDVVEATLDRIRSKCIFQNDHLFMRRLAYVATKDGTDPNYATGTGGIWQVPSNFASIRVEEKEKKIKDIFGIEWRKVSYDQLDIPLYSALATHLLIDVLVDKIKANKTKQAKYWANNWSNGVEKTFIDNADSIPMPTCSKAVDLVFLLDQSGSVGYKNYRNMKYFLSNITDKLTISQDAFQIGAVKFSRRADQVFPLNRYTTKSKIQEALINDKYKGGGTSISSGIKEAAEVIKQSKRKDATRVLLLLTDGRSNLDATTTAANTARNESNVVIYALGIGNINEEELNAAANQPTCTHKFVIDNFEEIDSLLYQIIKHTCGVSKPVNLAKESKIDISVPMTEDVVEDTLEVTPGTDDAITTLQVMAVCATVDLYASTETTNPNEAFHSTTEQATEEFPAVLEIGNKGAKVYVTYKGSVLHLDRCKAQGGSFNMTLQKGAPTVSKLVSLVYVSTAEMEVKLTEDNIEKTFEVIPGDDPKTTIKVTAACAEVDVYASIDTTRPDENSYTTNGKATEGLPAVLEVDNNGMTFYVTYKGSKLNLDRCKMHDGGFTITVTKGAPKGVEIVCRENGLERACTTMDLTQMCHGTGSQNGNHDVSNTQGSGMNGNANGGQTSYGSSGEGNDVSSSTCRQLEPDVPNPCGSVDSTYYYEYKNDDGYYVHCDEWGNACVRQCSLGTKWNNQKLTCDKLEAAAECQDGQANECAGDKTKYKVCVHNKWQELPCSPGTECKIATGVCGHPSARRGFDVKSLIKKLREYEDEKYEEEEPYDDE